MRRLSGHPSISLWGGNNEIEASFQWYEATKAAPTRYAADYQALFVELLGSMAAKVSRYI
mgnify:CR=1 FL=1